EVQFWVSNGKVAVPQVTGLTEDAAKDSLEKLGLEANVTEQEAPDQEPGTVTSQNPPAGGQVDIGSEVTIFVATERGPVSVPNVAGATLEDATATLQEAGFGVEPSTEPSDTVPEGRVIRTEPGAKEEAEYGATITVVVSSGPEQTTAPTPTEEPSSSTPSPEPTTTPTDPTTEPSADPTTPEETSAAEGDGAGNGGGTGNGNAGGNSNGGGNGNGSGNAAGGRG